MKPCQRTDRQRSAFLAIQTILKPARNYCSGLNSGTNADNRAAIGLLRLSHLWLIKQKPASDKQKQSRPVIIDGETVSSSSASSTQAEDVTAAVSRVFASLKRATQRLLLHRRRWCRFIQSTRQSASELQKKAAKAAIKAYLAQQENAKPPAINAAIEAKAQELVQEPRARSSMCVMLLIHVWWRVG